MNDGEVIINSKINTDGLEASVKEIEKACKELVSVAKEMSDALKQAATQMSSFASSSKESSESAEEYSRRWEQSLEDVLDAIFEEDDAMDEAAQHTEEYGDAVKQAAQDNEEFAEAVERMEDSADGSGVDDLGTKVKDAASGFDQANAAAQNFSQGLIDSSSTINSVTSGLSQMTSGASGVSSVFGELAGKLVDATAKMMEFTGSLSIDTIKEFTKQCNKAMTALMSLVGKTVQRGLSKVTSQIKEMATNMFHLGSSSESATGSLKNAFTTLLRYGFGIRSVFVLCNKLRNALIEGFENLEEYDKTTEASITSLTDSLTYLKNSFAAAFAPLLNYVIPILNQFIYVLAKAVNLLGRFFAYLTGQTSYVEAVPIEEYSDALDDVTDSANKTYKAIRHLSTLDELNIWEVPTTTSSSGTSSGTGSSVDNMFRTVDIGSWDFSSWGDAFLAFVEWLDTQGISKLESALGNISDAVNKFSANVYEMFTFPGVQEAVYQLGVDFAEAFNTMVQEEIDWETLGGALGAALQTALSFMIGFVYTFEWDELGSALATAFNSAFKEMDWYEIGQWLWVKFKIPLEILCGFLEDVDATGLGNAANELVNGFFQSMCDTIDLIEWDTIGQNISDLILAFDWENLGVQVANALNKIVDAVDQLDLGTALGQLINGFFTFARTTAEGFDWAHLGTVVGSEINDAIHTIQPGEIIGFFSAYFNGIKDTVVEIIKNIEWGEAISKLVDTGAGIIKAFYDALADGIEETPWREIGAAIRYKLESYPWDSIGYSIGRALKSAVEALKDMGIGEILGDILCGLFDVAKGIAEAWNEGEESGWDELRDIAVSCITAVFGEDGVWDTHKDQIFTFIDNLKQFICDLLDEIPWEDVGNAIADVLLGVDWGDIILSVAEAIIKALWNGMNLTIANGIFKFTSLGQDMTIQLIDGAEEAGEDEANWKDCINGIKEGFSNLFGKEKVGEDAGEEAATYMIDGMGVGFATNGEDAAESAETNVFKKIWNKFTDFFDIGSPSKLMEGGGGDIVDGLVNGLSNNWSSIDKELDDDLGSMESAFETTYSNIDSSSDTAVGTTLKKTLTTAWGKITKFFSGDDGTEVLEDQMADTWSDIDSTASGNDGWSKITSTLETAWGNIKSFFTGSNGTSSLEKTMSSSWSDIDSTASGNNGWGKITSSLKTAWGNIKSYFTGSDGTSSLETTMSDAWSNISSDASDSVSTTGWGKVKSTLSSAWSNIKSIFTGTDGVKDLESTLSGAWTQVNTDASAWDDVKSTISGFWSSIREGVLDNSSGVRLVESDLISAWRTIDADANSSVSGWGEIYNTISGAWSKIKSYLTDNTNGVGSVKTAISDVWNSLNSLTTSVWHNMANTIAYSLNAMLSAMNSAIPMMVKGVNSLVDSMNSALSWSYKLPDGSWGYYTSNLKGISSYPVLGSVSIPYLATGAVIPPNAPFMAVLGDQSKGNNIEAPEDTIRNIFRDEMGKLNNNGNTYNITAQARGRALFDLVLEEGRNQMTRTGRNPFDFA